MKELKHQQMFDYFCKQQQNVNDSNKLASFILANILQNKTKHNVLASLHELTNQNTLATDRSILFSFARSQKSHYKSATLYCFKKFVWVGNFAPIINKEGG